tara:strand:- start:798 stop:1433 length:636 start_codon:yes stop_codon:yes gene_type:complete
MSKIKTDTIEGITTDGALTLTPNGTGGLVTDHWTWPLTDGSANQYLKTDGSGNLDWVTAGGATKEFTVLAAANYVSDSLAGVFPYVQVGPAGTYANSVHPTTKTNATGAIVYSFFVPNDFTTLSAAVAVVIPDATETITFDLTTDWGASGEDHDGTSDSVANATFSATSQRMGEMDVSAGLTGIAAGDYVALRVSTDTSLVHNLFLRIKYS